MNAWFKLGLKSLSSSVCQDPHNLINIEKSYIIETQADLKAASLAKSKVKMKIFAFLLIFVSTSSRLKLYRRFHGSRGVSKGPGDFLP